MRISMKHHQCKINHSWGHQLLGNMIQDSLLTTISIFKWMKGKVINSFHAMEVDQLDKIHNDNQHWNLTQWGKTQLDH